MVGVLLRGNPVYKMAGEQLATASRETANLAVAVDDDRAFYLRQVPERARRDYHELARPAIPRDGTAIGRSSRYEWALLAMRPAARYSNPMSPQPPPAGRPTPDADPTVDGP